LRKRTM